MSPLDGLLGARTALTHEDAEHLQALVGEWQLLADLSFADLLLWVPTTDGRQLCVAQVRPTTGPTAYQHDLIEATADVEHAAILDDPSAPGRFLVRRTPDGPVIGIISRRRHVQPPASPSTLELAYTEAATALLGMVERALFPPAGASAELMTGPRAGDGLVLLEDDGSVRYASPNATSAYRRMGWASDLVHADLAAVTREVVSDRFYADELIARVTTALGGGSPTRLEVDAHGATVLFRALPLEHEAGDAGALVLVRDVTDVRRRDRQLLSKDATIREIHHRVKNNLQTVAALLRLQARRVDEPAVRAALTESVRRVSSIALVHETLSMSLDETVDFDEIVDRLIPMVTEVAAAESTIRIERDSSCGMLPAEVATPLVLVVVELLQNAVEHAYRPQESGIARVSAARRPGAIRVEVVDDGVGLPDGFALDGAGRLGLQIVQTLVESELRGSIEITRGEAARGTRAVVEIPLVRR
ncbi:sensor histidine kinase [Blastococcus sp. Marseille-P5729]|uniref:sensor histidine kinase n=1 Tax=Blastococcus sp. Marseille-P5729 TaxID=2086582 RepID=UPI000D0FBDB0|nr:sensor histidine kinase [Blastococcus sp. Marseille-P5729]